MVCFLVLREWLVMCRSLRYGTLIFREFRRTNEGIGKRALSNMMDFHKTISFSIYTKWLFTGFVVLRSLNRGRHEFWPSRVPRTVEGIPVLGQSGARSLIPSFVFAEGS